jgi:inhibitor of KinA sporulation pathway (predicted exonuclease)
MSRGRGRGNGGGHLNTSLMRLDKPKAQPFQYYLVLDFEATCDENNKAWQNEIIEFPTVVVDANTLEKITEFQQYVKPVQNPTLTPFCKDLTGIQQEWVDAGVSFKDALQLYHQWLIQNEFLTGTGQLNPNKTFLFVTCGDWDLNRMLRSQCERERVTMPAYFKSWCNIKKAFQDYYGSNPGGMGNMLRLMKLPLEGRHHSGIDDCRNIATILLKMIRNGATINRT